MCLKYNCKGCAWFARKRTTSTGTYCSKYTVIRTRIQILKTQILGIRNGIVSIHFRKMLEIGHWLSFKSLKYMLFYNLYFSLYWCFIEERFWFSKSFLFDLIAETHLEWSQNRFRESPKECSSKKCTHSTAQIFKIVFCLAYRDDLLKLFWHQKGVLI